MCQGKGAKVLDWCGGCGPRRTHSRDRGGGKEQFNSLGILQKTLNVVWKWSRQARVTIGQVVHFESCSINEVVDNIVEKIG